MKLRKYVLLGLWILNLSTVITLKIDYNSIDKKLNNLFPTENESDREKIIANEVYKIYKEDLKDFENFNNYVDYLKSTKTYNKINLQLDSNSLNDLNTEPNLIKLKDNCKIVFNNDVFEIRNYLENNNYKDLIYNSYRDFYKIVIVDDKFNLSNNLKHKLSNKATNDQNLLAIRSIVHFNKAVGIFMYEISSKHSINKMLDFTKNYQNV